MNKNILQIFISILYVSLMTYDVYILGIFDDVNAYMICANVWIAAFSVKGP